MTSTPQGLQRYEVFATIEHRGDSLQYGQYVSYIKKDENWYIRNDSTVMLLPKEDASPTRNVYIILLKKVTE